MIATAVFLFGIFISDSSAYPLLLAVNTNETGNIHVFKMSSIKLIKLYKMVIEHILIY